MNLNFFKVIATFKTLIFPFNPTAQNLSWVSLGNGIFAATLPIQAAKERAEVGGGGRGPGYTQVQGCSCCKEV